MDPTTGSIFIDKTDINSISINQVRASLNSLSQEAFFLHGTIRENLNTASSSSEFDERLQFVLKRVGLWSKISALGGLDVFLHPEESLSHGERQLFCLARALLNSSPILILDEFTSKYV
jgi:ATP-binding cassette subfamily C (CFTR/MRP) protein 1